MVVVSTHLIYTRSPPHFLAWNAVHLDVYHTHPPPDSAALSAPRAACLRMPSCPASFTPLLPSSACTHIPVAPWGFDRHGSICASVSRLPPCGSAPLPIIFWFLVSLAVLFARIQGPRAPPLPVSCLSPSPSPRYMATPASSVSQATPPPAPSPWSS